MSIVDRILDADDDERLMIYSSLTGDERIALSMLLDAEVSNPWIRFEGDAIGFITEGLGETLWSKQREIATSLIENQRTAVPACHAPGKSHLSARLVAWWIAVHPPGTAMAVTIAPTYRQVRNIIWPHIRRCAIQANLPGEVLTQTWKINGDIVSYGFSPSHYDESAAQGIHSPHLLIVVDEAGGIGEVVGQSLEALMTGGHTRLLLLGNPPTDNENSWFERCCNSPLYNVIPISAHDTPNFTGEEVGICRSCPAFVKPHPISDHLVDQRWVADVISEFGPDSPFVEARVFAKFPRATANKVIPFAWCEAAADNENPIQGEKIRLGVDVAADGGDEFVIAKSDGFKVSIEHRSSGIINQNAVDVAGIILNHIQDATETHKARGIKEPVHVKIDTIGVGWGVVSILQTWASEGKHQAKIVPINVSERANDPEKFRNQRAEMWWNGRLLLQPKETGADVRLNIDRKVMAQLAGPTFKADSAGRIQIESKVEMKRRGVGSPDRAEAVLLALYEPNKAREPLPVVPLAVGQSNYWSGSAL